jgi:hypothetical protein
MRRITTVLLALAIVGAFATAAVAQVQLQYNVVVTGDIVKGSARDHFLTFDEPVRIPEATLPAGTYIFTILGSSTVQVSTADRSQQLAMFFTTPVARPDAARAYELTLLRPQASGQGRITQWFLPYQTVGLEFLYSNEEVRGER